MLTRYENMELGLIELTKEKKYAPYESGMGDFYITRGIINGKIRFIRRLQAFKRQASRATIAVMPIIQSHELQAYLNPNEIISGLLIGMCAQVRLLIKR